MAIGILALQGAFAEHRAILESLGAECFEIRSLRDLELSPEGLIFPGGESTAMRRLLHRLDLFTPIRTLIQGGLPVLGTCAGLLLLAKEIDGGEPCFATMDITAMRNAYGRQLGSFSAWGPFGQTDKIPMRFIRAPYILSAGPDVELLSSIDGKAVAARQNNQLVTAFHPELTPDRTVHRQFLSMVSGQA